MEVIKTINKSLVLPFVGLIWLYQLTISPDHGVFKFLHPYGYCKFYPSCSEYARQTLLKEGFVGLPKAFKRLASCTPTSLGGVDLP